MKHDDDAFERGMKLGIRLGGDAFQQTVDTLAASDPELARYLVADGYGKVLSRSGLDLAERELVIMAALACRAHQPQLKWHLSAALNIGVTAEAVREVLVQAIPYAGWPTALNALATMAAVFTERGVKLPPHTPSAVTREQLRQRGLANGGEVYADYPAVEAVLAGYDAELPAYLTENSYGQVYARDGLSLRHRELVAIAMLTAQQQLTQLGWHIHGALRVGCTLGETKEVIVTLLLYLGWPSTLNALEVWKQSSAKQGVR